MSDADPFARAIYRPSLSLKSQGEPLWTIEKDAGWSAELQFLGESWGWMTRILHHGDFRLGGRFTLKSEAEEWAAEVRQWIESDDWPVD